MPSQFSQRWLDAHSAFLALLQIACFRFPCSCYPLCGLSLDGPEPRICFHSWIKSAATASHVKQSVSFIRSAAIVLSNGELWPMLASNSGTLCDSGTAQSFPILSSCANSDSKFIDVFRHVFLPSIPLRINRGQHRDSCRSVGGVARSSCSSSFCGSSI